jgi:hypothetical protein
MKPHSKAGIRLSLLYLAGCQFLAIAQSSPDSSFPACLTQQHHEILAGRQMLKDLFNPGKPVNHNFSRKPSNPLANGF